MQDITNQIEQRGIEKTYDYPYNKVFRACEDATLRMAWQIQESNFEEGYIHIIHKVLLSTIESGIKVKKLNNNKTTVKILYFGSPFQKVQEDFSKGFFSRLDALLNRDR